MKEAVALVTGDILAVSLSVHASSSFKGWDMTLDDKGACCGPVVVGKKTKALMQVMK